MVDCGPDIAAEPHADKPGADMSRSDLIDSLRRTIEQNIPLPGCGQTAARHMRLMDVGRQDLVLARLAEAHWDAVAILAEVGREPKRSAIYGV